MSRLVNDGSGQKEELARQIKSLHMKLGRSNPEDSKSVMSEVLKLSKKVTEFQTAQSQQIAQQVAKQLTPVQKPKLRSPMHSNQRVVRNALSMALDHDEDEVITKKVSSPLHSFIDRHKVCSTSHFLISNNNSVALN